MFRVYYSREGLECPVLYLEPRRVRLVYKRTLKISIALGIALLTVMVTYNNCGSAVNTMDLAAQALRDGFPQNSYVWRPNRLASFSCSSDSSANANIGSDPRTYPFPTVMVWQQPESPFTDDPYATGFGFTHEVRRYIIENDVTPKQVREWMPAQFLTFGPIMDVTDSSAEGWRFPYADDRIIARDTDLDTSKSEIRNALFDQVSGGVFI